MQNLVKNSKMPFQAEYEKRVSRHCYRTALRRIDLANNSDLAEYPSQMVLGQTRVLTLIRFLPKNQKVGRFLKKTRPENHGQCPGRRQRSEPLQQRELVGPLCRRFPRSSIGQRRRILHPRPKRHFEHFFYKATAMAAFSYSIQGKQGRSSAARVTSTISGVWNFAHADCISESHVNDVSCDSNPTESMFGAE